MRPSRFATTSSSRTRACAEAAAAPACHVKDGIVVAAAEDERFTHVKHGKRPVPFSTWELPFHAIDFCLRTAGITLNEVDHVAYSFDPALLLGKGRDDPTVPIPLKHGP